LQGYTRPSILFCLDNPGLKNMNIHVPVGGLGESDSCRRRVENFQRGASCFSSKIIESEQVLCPD
jgi:hypothetical protein